MVPIIVTEKLAIAFTHHSTIPALSSPSSYSHIRVRGSHSKRHLRLYLALVHHLKFEVAIEVTENHSYFHQGQMLSWAISLPKRKRHKHLCECRQLWGGVIPPARIKHVGVLMVKEKEKDIFSLQNHFISLYKLPECPVETWS